MLREGEGKIQEFREQALDPDCRGANLRSWLESQELWADFLFTKASVPASGPVLGSVGGQLVQLQDLRLRRASHLP